MTKTILAASVAALLACASLPAHAAYTEGNPECQKLLHDGDDLRKAGKMTEALHTYADAAKADPASSAPISRIAVLYFTASTATKPELVDPYRAKALAAANEALKKEPTDPNALAVIRELDSGRPAPAHVPTAEASAEFQMAEAAFQKKQYDDAIAHYQKAAALDPQFDLAWVYLGDCYFATGRYAEAEKDYRRATDINPMNSQAWRFLSDALIRQQKFDQVPQVLSTAIAAAPNDMPSWDHLEAFLKARQAPMQHLNLQRHASYDPVKKSLNIDPTQQNKDDPLTPAIWLGYGMAQATAEGKNESAFAKEYEAWQTAFKLVEEKADSTKAVPSDPALALLYRFYKEGQLKEALFILAYREAWRPDFEAWKKENPNGVKAFIDTWHVRP